MSLRNTLKTVSLGLLAGIALTASALAADGKLIVIITPSHDNPFFK